MSPTVMPSPAHGTNTSASEVTNISSHGIWILTRTGKEHFLPYTDFPWFRNQPVSAIINLEEPVPGHFHWPDMDVDLNETIIENPSAYPLTSG